jgi:hypothetical protein
MHVLLTYIFITKHLKILGIRECEYLVFLVLVVFKGHNEVVFKGHNDLGNPKNSHVLRSLG